MDDNGDAGRLLQLKKIIFSFVQEPLGAKKKIFFSVLLVECVTAIHILRFLAKVSDAILLN